ncbi:hypothetical protein [Reichenbachiella sp.]|uniref:hypothetical protein n=1 Tax=Reichenbachiella sp. TaxID=2184521 RepID=UPI003BB0E0B5
MKLEHQLFAKHSLFRKPKKALEIALKESGKLNVHGGDYAYYLSKQAQVHAYKDEFVKRLQPFVDMVFEQMRDFNLDN